MTLEEQAIAFGNDPLSLKTRLTSTVTLLKKEYRQHFRRVKFDFEAKQLIGTDGYYLQWLVREEPDEPESYENQQTSQGTVVLMRRYTADEFIQELFDLGG